MINLNKKCVQPEHGRIRENGFTLIELSLAMTFLAFIMLFIVTLIMQMIGIYNKSIALSQMNNSGQQIMTDMNTMRFGGNLQVSGNRLCVNGATYVWSLRGNTPATADANIGRSSLIRISSSDPNSVSGIYCSAPSTTLSTTNMTVLISSGILLQQFNPSITGDLLNLKMTVSTGNSNAPYVISSKKAADSTNNDKTTQFSANLITCLNDKNKLNNYCAYADYNFSIYRRGN